MMGNLSPHWVSLLIAIIDLFTARSDEYRRGLKKAQLLGEAQVLGCKPFANAFSFAGA